MNDAPLVVVACDKFKGSLTASQVNEEFARGLREAEPSVQVRQLPIADGGDGTVAALVASGFEPVPVAVTGPTGEPVTAHYAVKGDTAVVELADTCGLLRLPGGRRQALTASSRGFGEAIAAAVDAGASTVVLGLGGSASTDGGAGMLRALGARMYDAAGRELPEGGGALPRLDRLDLSGLDPRLRETELVVAGDVDNPLLGPRGAVATFSAQKGATPADQRVLNVGLQRFATLVAAATGHDLSATAGAGAAGGVGFAALAVLGARMERGVDLLLDCVGFVDVVRGADLVVTGEGSFDHQTLSGKAPLGVVAAARRASLPVVVVCGRTDLSTEVISDFGIGGVYPLTALEPDASRCIASAGSLLRRVGHSVANDLLRTES